MEDLETLRCARRRGEPCVVAAAVPTHLNTQIAGGWSLIDLDLTYMAVQGKRVVAIGEVLIELARGNDGRFGIACGSDIFNTAVYLSRANTDVAYATALGEDPYSDGIVALATAEGVVTDLILRKAGRLPGMYLVDVDANRGHRFHYWRESSPARELLELSEWTRVAEGLLSAHLIYYSGITLSLYSNSGLGRFLAIIETARQKPV